MRKTAPWLLVAALTIAMFGTWASAGADSDAKGPLSVLRRRVAALEIRADRQRRQIVDLRGRTNVLASKVLTLENFMGETKPRLTSLENFQDTAETMLSNHDSRLDALESP